MKINEQGIYVCERAWTLKLLISTSETGEHKQQLGVWQSHLDRIPAFLADLNVVFQVWESLCLCQIQSKWWLGNQQERKLNDISCIYSFYFYELQQSVDFFPLKAVFLVLIDVSIPKLLLLQVVIESGWEAAGSEEGTAGWLNAIGSWHYWLRFHENGRLRSYKIGGTCAAIHPMGVRHWSWNQPYVKPT